MSQTLRDWLLAKAETVMQREETQDASHDFDHIQRTLALAERIQKHEGGQLPIIQAAVAFHDIGLERERIQGGDHAQIGAEMAGEILQGQDSPFPDQLVPEVQRAIREHRMTGKAHPTTIEGRILYDADKIDCLGATGIARLYCITGHYNQKIYSELPPEIEEPVDPLTVRELRRRRDYSPSIEFRLLFDELHERMTTTTGQTLAEERYMYMAGFFRRLQREISGEA